MLFDELWCNVIHNTPLTTQVIKGSKHLKKRKKRTSDVKEFEKKKYGVENWKVFTCISRRYLKSIYSNFLLIIGSPSESVWWPAGSYGIPKPVSGCPRTTGFQWKKGWRSQDTNGASSKNARSLDFHLDAEVDETKVQRSFCIKTSIIDDHNRPKWPQGNN